MLKKLVDLTSDLVIFSLAVFYAYLGIARLSPGLDACART